MVAATGAPPAVTDAKVAPRRDGAGQDTTRPPPVTGNARHTVPTFYCLTSLDILRRVIRVGLGVVRPRPQVPEAKGLGLAVPSKVGVDHRPPPVVETAPVEMAKRPAGRPGVHLVPVAETVQTAGRPAVLRLVAPEVNVRRPAAHVGPPRDVVGPGTQTAQARRLPPAATVPAVPVAAVVHPVPVLARRLRLVVEDDEAVA